MGSCPSHAGKIKKTSKGKGGAFKTITMTFQK